MNSQLPAHLIAHINVKLALIGCSPVPLAGDREFVEIAAAMAAQSREKDRLLGQHLCPVDQRIQAFLYDYLQDVPVPKLPARTFALDRAGLAACSRCRWTARIFRRISSIPTASSRAFCTIPKATGARRREFSTSPRAACRFPTTSWACRKRRSQKFSSTRSRRRRTC